MKSNFVYRSTASLIAFSALICVFFLKLFSFSLNMVITIKSYDFSIRDILMTFSGGSSSGTLDKEKLLEAVQPMLNDTIVFIVMLSLAILICVALIFLCAATDFHIPQMVLSFFGFLFTVIGSGFGTRALSKLMTAEGADAPEVALSSLAAATVGEITTENALSTLGTTLGSAFVKVTGASLSYGYYALMVIFIVMFLWSLFGNIFFKKGQQVGLQ